MMYDPFPADYLTPDAMEALRLYQAGEGRRAFRSAVLAMFLFLSTLNLVVMFTLGLFGPALLSGVACALFIVALVANRWGPLPAVTPRAKGAPLTESERMERDAYRLLYAFVFCAVLTVAGWAFFIARHFWGRS